MASPRGFKPLFPVCKFVVHKLKKWFLGSNVGDFLIFLYKFSVTCAIFCDYYTTINTLKSPSRIYRLEALKKRAYV